MANVQATKTQILIENAELRGEVKRLKQDRLASIAGSSVNTLIVASTIAFACYCAYLSIASLAGHTTNANILMNILADIRFERVVMATCTGAGVGYGWRQRRLRMKLIEQFESQKREMERLIDPNRSSSLLTSSGETNPLDRGNI